MLNTWASASQLFFVLLVLHGGVKMHSKKFALLVMFLWVIAPWDISAQVITASLQGTVRDQSGAVIAGATVDVRNTATNVQFHQTTGANGVFIVPALPPGSYTVTVKDAGFKTLESSAIVLEVDQRAQVQYILEIGSDTETVAVTSAAPLLQTSTSDMGQVIDAKEIMNLPLNQRNPFSLAFLAPGINGSVGADANSADIVVNGGRPGSTEILLDGVPSSPRSSTGVNVFSVFPLVDATQEFKVQTSSYSAQFGNAGSGIINVVYKSGTNRLHGDVYEFLRNSALDSNSFFNKASGIPLPTFQRSQFGFTVGGPVLLPKIYNGRNRTFFFGDYEGLRQGTNQNTLTTVPTDAMKAGDFSDLINSKGNAVTIYDPNTTAPQGSNYVRSAFPGNKIPPSRFDPVAANVLKYWPEPNLPGDVNNFSVAGKEILNINNYDVKIDENVGDKSHFSGRVSRHLYTDIPMNIFPEAIRIAQGSYTSLQHGTGVALDFTYTLSPKFLTEVRYGFARTVSSAIPISEGYDPTKLGLPGYIAQHADMLVFPGFNPNGYYGVGNGGSYQPRIGFNEHSLSVNNTWIVKTHVFNFGFQLDVPQTNALVAGHPDGNFKFTRAITQGPNPLKASATAGDGFAAFLLGVGSGTMTIGAANAATTSQTYAVYLEDDWKVLPKLTLNLGLRYDLAVPRTERYNRMSYFDPTVPSPLAGPSGLSDLKGGLVFVGVNGAGRRQFSTQLANYAPRVGFSYEATTKVAIRGGFGIFWAPALTGASGAASGQAGYYAQSTFTGSADNLTATNYLSNPFPGGPVIPTGNKLGLSTLVGQVITGPLHNERDPYTENWNFDIQEMLPGSILLDEAYVGSRGLQLADGTAGTGGSYDSNLNQLTPATLALGTALTQKVANPFYGTITSGPLSTQTVPMSYLLAPFPQFDAVGPLYPTGASSIYHSLQLKAERRIASGVSILAAFTGSKLIDDYSRSASVGNSPPAGGIQNIYDRRADRSVSTNDISRVFSFAGVYQLPFGRSRHFGRQWNGLTDAFLGGWQANGILMLQTGFPLALSTADTSDSGTSSLRPNYNLSATGCSKSAKLSGSVRSRLSEYFNTSCFVQPAPFTFGDVGRTLSNVRAPGQRDLDFSIFKDFQVAERYTLEFHAESFNLLNQVQFGPPNTGLNDSSFGVISSQANSPRQMQFALKVIF